MTAQAAAPPMWQADGPGHVERGSFVVQKMSRPGARKVFSGFRVTHFYHGGTQRHVSFILPNYRAVQDHMDEREATGPRGGDWAACQAAAEAFVTPAKD